LRTVVLVVYGFWRVVCSGWWWIKRAETCSPYI